MKELFLKPILTICSVLLFVGVGDANDIELGSTEDFTELSLEALMDVTVTSASKKEESLMEAASAIYVVTQEDIRRTGVTSIPEALRMVPGVQVARIDSNTWAITARGFNSRFASKLLVLIDGRSVYQIVTSGVNWDTVDLALEDIDRIEVIRGPGSTLWGANAVNGVINIITKHSKDTQGVLVTAGAGKEEEVFETVRFGAQLAEGVYLRGYQKYFQRDKYTGRGMDPATDDWDAIRGGFRLDWEISEKNSLSFQGDYYDGTSSNWAKDVVTGFAPTESFRRDVQVDGGFISARWDHVFSNTSDMALQVYFNRERRDNTSAPRLHMDTYDVDFQHRFALGERQEIVWGFEERVVLDSYEDVFFPLSFDPNERVTYQFSGFIEDEITVIPDQLKLIVGSKFEENNFTGFEYQPSARMLWTPNERYSAWASVSRAVRIPARVEVGGRNNSAVLPGPTLVSFLGNKDQVSEELLSYQAGVRLKPNDRIFLDVSGFYNFYDNLLSVEAGSVFPEATPLPAHFVLPFNAGNTGNGETYGIEVAGEWKIMDCWTLKGGFTWFNIDLYTDDGSLDSTFETLEGNDPEFQGHIRSFLDLPYNLEFDAAVYFMDQITGFDPINGPDPVSGYTRVDLRLGWKPIEELELSVIAQNIQNDNHEEFGNQRVQLIGRTQVERSVFGKITWRP